MSIVVEYMKDCGIRNRCKGLSASEIDELLVWYESELVKRYGYDIDALADMAHGRIPDLTKEADYELTVIC